MKKLFITFFLILTSFISNAQCWDTIQTKADPLLGTKEMRIETFSTENCIVSISEGSIYFELKDGSGIFDVHTVSSISSGKMVVAGLYDENNVLIKKISNRSLQVSKDFKFAKLTPFAGATKIVNHINLAKGNIRIVINRFRGENLDIIIPCKSSCTE